VYSVLYGWLDCLGWMLHLPGGRGDAFIHVMVKELIEE